MAHIAVYMLPIYHTNTKSYCTLWLNQNAVTSVLSAEHKREVAIKESRITIKPTSKDRECKP